MWRLVLLLLAAPALGGEPDTLRDTPLALPAEPAPVLARRAAHRPRDLPSPPSPVAGLCRMISAAARAHDLPEDFFARLIWKESRFDLRAVSPAGAEGVAQFMPETARRRGLSDPFDPALALPASAAFLAELRARFGNLGLAAAGYNGGPERVSRWLARGGRLPWETLDYVQDITGRPVVWFREPGREVEPRPLAEGRSFQEGCEALPVLATRARPVAAPWGVEVAGGINAGAARRAAGRVQRAYQALLSERPIIVIRARRAAGRPRFSASFGAESRREAQIVCARLRDAGTPCRIRRN
ncbi:MAG: lytic transglycosylase domain-containing protein [Pseudomonadota bacterium]